MVHQFRFWTCVSDVSLTSLALLIVMPAGIIEGANDGKGRGRQGMSISHSTRKEIGTLT